jgi:excisionase family DNA binding protein
MGLTRMTKIEDLPSLLTVKEAAAFLGLGLATVYIMVDNGHIPSKRFGRCIRIPKEAFMSTLEKSSTES